MFIAALFTMAKLWDQPRCPLTSKWVKKMWCLYNGVYSAIKKNGVMLFAGEWVALEIM
jgi:hypothetical protein